MKPVIDFKSEGVHFYFQIDREFTKICDNSGVGKSFLCDSLKTALSTYCDTGIYPVKDKETKENIKTIVIDGLNISESEAITQLSTVKSLIIIDEADILFSKYKNLSNIVIKNDTSIFVLIARSVIEELPFGYSEYAKVINKDKELLIEYFS